MPAVILPRLALIAAIFVVEISVAVTAEAVIKVATTELPVIAFAVTAFAAICSVVIEFDRI